MKKILLVFLVLASTLSSWSQTKVNTISQGEQPQASLDTKGVIRVVFGQEDKVFCATSKDQGGTFSKPVLVAEVPGMHLGMSRGPQIASSDTHSVITAMDKTGNIHWFELSNESDSWKPQGIVNDQSESAPEGLMSIAADKKDNFYAVWLDTRIGKRNQIFFSSLSKGDSKWSKNQLAYQSPDEHVCECCKPSIAVNGTEVAIMFRNWLEGSRDLYVAKSSDSGKSFGNAQRLGMGTWKLEGCPMDGGGIVIDDAKGIHTTWRREGIVYYSKPGAVEIKIGEGRNSSISGTSDTILISMQSGDAVKSVSLKGKIENTIGKGSYLKSIVLPDKKVFYIWEQDREIKFQKAE
ncbi:MAG: hypothetical protein PSV36_08170 [Algoriphagus sp.]|nr:hypothetical protein [Algoriphagus sp.]